MSSEGLNRIVEVDLTVVLELLYETLAARGSAGSNVVRVGEEIPKSRVNHILRSELKENRRKREKKRVRCVTFYIDYYEGFCHGVACLMSGIGMRCNPLTLLLVGCWAFRNLCRRPNFEGCETEDCSWTWTWKKRQNLIEGVFEASYVQIRFSYWFSVLRLCCAVQVAEDCCCWLLSARISEFQLAELACKRVVERSHGRLCGVCEWRETCLSSWAGCWTSCWGHDFFPFPDVRRYHGGSIHGSCSNCVVFAWAMLPLNCLMFRLGQARLM